jgi:hypothetical protein
MIPDAHVLPSLREPQIHLRCIGLKHPEQESIGSFGHRA